MHPFLDSPGVLALAHRGGGSYEGTQRACADLPPENTMAAFAGALRLGYRYLETDVRASADGRLIVFHDASLDRLTDRTGPVEAQPWAELAGARVRGTEPIPLLEDVLDAWPEARFNVDVKAGSAVGPLVAVLRRTGAHDRVCVGSFSDRRLRAVRRALGPRLCTSLGPREVARLLAVALGTLPVRSAPRAAACAQLPTWLLRRPAVARRLVRTAHRLGLPVHAWVVDSREEMEGLLDLGVDGLVSGRLDALRDVLRARGAWAA